MHDLSYYLRLWNLTRPEKIAQTKMCDVYKTLRSDGTVCALKVMNEIGVQFESDSFQWYEFMDGRGAARLYGHDANAMLMEYLDGGELSDIVFNGRDDEASDIAIEVIRALHGGQDRTDFPPFKTLEEHYRCLSDTAMTHDLLPPAQMLAKELIGTQKDEDVRVLHADMHHKNILNAARGWLAIDPQNVIGDRHYEPANLFKNPEGFDGVFDNTRIEKIEGLACDVLGLNRQRLRGFVFTHMMLSACWHVLDGEDASWPLQMAEILYKRLNQ